jgi:hypothetical protein
VTTPTAGSVARLGKGASQVREDAGAERVAYVRPVESDPADAGIDLIEHVVLAHLVPPFVVFEHT